MKKSATEVMQEIVFSAVIDAIAALKAASKGVPNTLLRDLNSVHVNTTFGDLPPELQAAISANVRSAFARLLKEGYSVSGGEPSPSRHAPPPRDRVPQSRPQRRPPPKRDGPDGGRPPRGPGRPKPRPPR